MLFWKFTNIFILLQKTIAKKKIAVAPQLFKIVFDMDQEFLGYQSKFSEALRQVKKKQISAQNFWIGVL